MPPSLTNALLGQGLQMRHLRLAAALRDSGQVSIAAEQIGLTQPAASRMLGELEKILGVPFCTRGPRGIHLTAVGDVFAERACRILIELDTADDELGLVARGEQGRVRVGAVTAASISIVLPVIEEMTQSHPGIRTEISVGTSEALAQQLMEGAIDFALCRIPDRMEARLFEARQLKHERISIIAHAGHPLADRTVPERDLADERWVMQPQGTPLRRAVERHFMGQGLEPPNVVTATTSLLIHVAMVTRAQAIAAVASDVKDLLVTDRLGPLGIRDIQLPVHPMVSPFSLLRLRHHRLLPAAERAYQKVHAHALGQAGTGTTAG
ncbi:LysR family transcriptional regulator [Phaeobacter sp. G2]|nr:LysR family transcriptional regulator [Phaeobacter sp. G2]